MIQKLKSLRFRMLLPVVAMTLFVVILLTTLFSRAFIRMVLQQEQEVNAVGFDTISHSIAPLIDSSISVVRSVMSDDRVASYARFQYASTSELVHARNSCRDYLRSEITRHDGIFGLLFMRRDGSLFGTLPDGNFFLDDPKQNPLPEKMTTQILNVPLGQTVWIGPISGADIYGFQNGKTPQNIMIAAWKSVDVSYGECYSLMLIDDSIFDRMFAALQDGNSTWHLFTADQAEIYHTGQESCLNPDRLISESNSGMIFHDENNRPVCAFSMTMASPTWTMVREVSMENYEQVVHQVRRSVSIIAIVVFLIALAIYELWLKKFMDQFKTLLKGIIRMGQGELEPIASAPFSITEFETMQQEINRTSLALNHQMDTIRRMEREQMELENRKKEQERILRELSMAREIQESAIPQIFPPFPDRSEFSLYASMTPAKEVGGDFYDFFQIDSDHLALVIADVSGKGIPAALFMMVSKTLIKNELMTGCDPATALKRVNLQLSERNSSMTFVTVWLAVIELSTGKGVACNAGHEHPALCRSGGKFRLLPYSHDMLVGARKKAQYHIREFEMNPGDCLFVYTDGVPEANNAAEEMFGEKRLIEALNQNSDAEPEELLGNVRKAIDDFVKDAPQYDDITMLSFKYYGISSVTENNPEPHS
ncbi:MAG: PP2C family protein-serine/threonine phosphatase [Oscillospiraceae bacterium]|nr:PP2C family protein-serine/threonine phosphatase [Oscillospiraceae bacterium]